MNFIASWLDMVPGFDKCVPGYGKIGNQGAYERLKKDDNLAQICRENSEVFLASYSENSSPRSERVNNGKYGRKMGIFLKGIYYKTGFFPEVDERVLLIAKKHGLGTYIKIGIKNAGIESDCKELLKKL